MFLRSSLKSQSLLRLTSFYPLRSKHVIGIRREDQSPWERRSPLAPEHVRTLVKKHNIKVLIQASNRRAFPILSYIQAGAIVQEDLSEASVIIGVKQVPADLLIPNKVYVIFSHTHKAQKDNMPLLDACLEKNITLIDYEKIVDDQGARLVAFGKYAGVVGMINILHGLGLRFLALGHHTPFMVDIYKNDDWNFFFLLRRIFLCLAYWSST
jgi:alpha-aminoadipic semialdehyde synthase